MAATQGKRFAVIADEAHSSQTGEAAAKQADRQASQAASLNSFAALARELHRVKSPMWTEGHATRWMVNMEKYAFPVIGDRPIAEIEPMELVGIMRDVETQGTFETRDRLLQTISSTFKYAIAVGKAKYNPADIRMALADRPKVENFACLTTDEIPSIFSCESPHDHFIRRHYLILRMATCFTGISFPRQNRGRMLGILVHAQHFLLTDFYFAIVTAHFGRHQKSVTT